MENNTRNVFKPNEASKVTIIYGLMPDAPVFQTLSQALAYIATPPSHYQLYLDDHECKIYRNRKPTQFHTANRVLVSREDGTIIESFPLVREEPPVQEEITQDVYDTIQLELERMGCQYLPDVSAPDGKIAVAVPAGIRDLGRTLTLPLTLLNDRLAK